MDLKQLEYFVHVAEFGSFTHASRFLSVAQPALSRQVRALEVELRQPLFERNGRGVTLTEAGKRLLAHSRGLLQQVERARLDLESHRGEPVGRLVIGLPPSVSRTLTGPLVRTFREQLPGASLGIVEGLSTHVLEWLAIGRVDCAVVYNAVPSPEVELSPVLEEPLYLVSARGKSRTARLIGAPVTLAAVAQHDLVIPSRPHAMRMLLEGALAAEGHKAKVALEIESIPAMLDLVQHDGFHAVLSLNAIQSSGNADALQVRAISRPRLTATLWIATSARRHGGPLIDAATRLVRALVLQHWA
ncbi:MAG: LysR substrate-binding domain-containing protein [Rhizobacter sp.]|nr:LysR substrate-binding domain-containing protein [Rhizobacter sp.]